ncbi:hypothetical protein [Kalamiella sp. sgz302252]|uniref:hypothetical protein n=1 Tax=Pantoea sp. sgz302252 TaxID=3341827 RepID=UPI0036D38640
MKNHKNERLKDVIIGEAVLKLLSEKAAVSWRAVLAKLEAVLHAGLNEEKKRAAMMAIQEVKEEIQRRSNSMAGNTLLMPAANDS